MDSKVMLYKCPLLNNKTSRDFKDIVPKQFHQELKAEKNSSKNIETMASS